MLINEHECVTKRLPVTFDLGVTQHRSTLLEKSPVIITSGKILLQVYHLKWLVQRHAKRNTKFQSQLRNQKPFALRTPLVSLYIQPELYNVDDTAKPCKVGYSKHLTHSHVYAEPKPRQLENLIHSRCFNLQYYLQCFTPSSMI